MTLTTLSFILGAVLILAGILGGGFEAKELKIPKISGIARILAVVVGAIFVGLAFIPPASDTSNTSQSATIANEKTTKVTMSTMDRNTDRPGLDYQNFDLPKDDPNLCQEACESDSQCKAWTFVRPNTVQGPKPRCWLKHAIPPPVDNPCCVSGTKLQ